MTDFERLLLAVERGLSTFDSENQQNNLACLCPRSEHGDGVWQIDGLFRPADIVTAILTEMREPSEALVIEAYARTEGHCPHEGPEPAACWTAMIDAIFQGKAMGGDC